MGKTDKLFRLDSSYSHPVKQSIDCLIKSLISVLADSKDIEVFKAAAELRKELEAHNQVLKISIFPATTSTGMSMSAFNALIIDYAENCQDSIYKYQSKIMAAPNTLDQSKAKIAGYIERYTTLTQSKIKAAESNLTDTNPEAIEAFRLAKETIKNTKENPVDESLYGNPVVFK